MNRSTYLGELEQMVLLTVLRLGPDARTSGVRSELATRAGRKVARGAVYITLDRTRTRERQENQAPFATTGSTGCIPSVEVDMELSKKVHSNAHRRRRGQCGDRSSFTALPS